LLIVLLFALLMLAACGGDTPAATDAGPEADVAAVAKPTTEVLEAEPAPTEPPAPPTDAPPTAAPEPTAVPTDEPTAEPATESAGLALPDGLCANPYFPVVEGRTYTYQSTVPDFGTSTYSFTFANVTDTSFDWLLGTDGETLVTYTWQCTADGLLSPNIQLSTGGPEITIETIESSGVTFPTAANVQVGTTWTTRHVFNTIIGDTGIGAMTTSNTVGMVNEIVAIEPVTTPYGEFEEAIKVQATGTMSMVSSLNGEALPAVSFDMATNTWYVEGVGQVRSEDLSDLMGTGDSAPTVTELVSIE
jgi:hypothetical protein